MSESARSRRRRWRLILGCAAGLILVLFTALAVAARGGVEVSQTTNPARAPTWTSPCRGRTPRKDRVLLAVCSRAVGLVLYVRHKGGQGQPYEVHFAMLAGFHPLLVKLSDPIRQKIPSAADRVTVTGALVRASDGMREIQAWSIR